MKRLRAGSLVILALVCGVMTSLTRAYAAEPPQESGRALVEIMLFKVELTSKNPAGLTWGKSGEMRERDAVAIVEWLKKQGEITLLCARSFRVEDRKETGIWLGTTVGINTSARVPEAAPPHRDYRDVGTSATLMPEISGDEIRMKMRLDVTFRLKPRDTLTGKYSLNTALCVKNGRTWVADEVWTDTSADQPFQTALVLLITPRIVK